MIDGFVDTQESVHRKNSAAVADEALVVRAARVGGPLQRHHREHLDQMIERYQESLTMIFDVKKL